MNWDDRVIQLEIIKVKRLGVTSLEACWCITGSLRELMGQGSNLFVGCTVQIELEHWARASAIQTVN